LKSLDDDLKSQPKQIWKHVAPFRKINYASVLLEVGGRRLIEANDEFSKNFQSV
jgi:hypothetical protein